MTLDTSYTITAIIAVIALLSPVITTLINNHHLSVIKKLDYSQENHRELVLHKRKLLENYLLAVGALSVVPVTDEKITNFSDMGERLNEFTQAYYLILPYIPAKEHNYFAEYSSETCKMDFSADSYNKLANLLGKHILPTIRAEIDKL